MPYIRASSNRFTRMCSPKLKTQFEHARTKKNKQVKENAKCFCFSGKSRPKVIIRMWSLICMSKTMDSWKCIGRLSFDNHLQALAFHCVRPPASSLLSFHFFRLLKFDQNFCHFLNVVGLIDVCNINSNRQSAWFLLVCVSVSVCVCCRVDPKNFRAFKWIFVPFLFHTSQSFQSPVQMLFSMGWI